MNKYVYYILKLSKNIKLIILLILLIMIIEYFLTLKLCNLNNNLNHLYNKKKFLFSKFKNKIKIGVYSYNLRNGGIQRITSIMINYFYKINIFNIYLYTHNIKEENEYIIPEKINRIIIKNTKINNIIKEIKKKKIEIFIFHFSNYHQIIKLNNLKTIKVIYYIHYSIFYWIYNKYQTFIKIYKAYQHSKYIVSLVPFENDFLFKKWGIRSIFMNSFTTYEYYNVIISDLSSKLILMIGRTHEKLKRFELGIQAMEYIIEEIPDSIMKIISNITSTNYLKNLVNNLNLLNNIEFVNYTTQPEKYFKNASLHIFSTISESFGLVLSEVKAYGIPSILLGLNYVTISNGGTIIIYDDLPETISFESLKILKNEKYKKKLSKAARKSMLKFNNTFLIDKWIELILSIYNEDIYYENLRKHEKILEEKEAIKLLKQQIELLQKRNPIYKNISINVLENFTSLESNDFKI